MHVHFNHMPFNYMLPKDSIEKHAFPKIKMKKTINQILSKPLKKFKN